jgi:shikimate dehydrogenase
MSSLPKGVADAYNTGTQPQPGNLQSMTDLYAVIGNPIEHSKSPLIHAAFARQTGQDMRYDRILGDPDGFEADVETFFDAGGLGLNVTVPFKERAFAMAERLSARARGAGAVNTLLLREAELFGDNTDGVGLVRDLGCNHLFGLKGARLLLLGAGGAARGVLYPLLREGPARLVLANRTASRARELATAAADFGKVTGCGLDELAGQRFDLIINATAAGLDRKVPEIPDDCLAEGGWAYDMLYGDRPTAFVEWGRAHRAARALDGLGMLVEQAAESFRIWRGVQPDTAAVIASLRRA